MAFKLIVQNSKIVLKSVANYIINASGIKDLLTGTSNVDTNGKIDWTLQHYADTAANFTSANPTLLVGQIGIETDNLLTTPKFKIGDGANDWNTLPYANSTSGGTWGSITGTLSNQTDLQTALNAKEDTANKSTNLNTDQASNTKYPSVKAVYDWATGLFVKKGTLTTNYIPKATSSDTIGDSQIFDDGTNVGIGTIAPTATIHGKGIDATSSNYALKVDNSASSALLYVRNDGIVSIGKTLQIQRYNYSSTKAFWIEADITENTLMSTQNADLVFKTRSSGTVETMRMTNAGKIIINNGSYLTLGVLDPTLDKYAYIDSAGNITASAGLKFSVCTTGTTTGMVAMQIEAGGNVGIGTSPTARTHIQGVDATSSNYALKVDNSASSPLLYVANNGNVSIGISTALSKMHVFGIDSATKVNQRLEPVSGVTEDTTGNTVNTTDATANVTAQTIAVPTDKVISIESTIVYRKTGGAGVGTTGDGTTIKLNSSVKNVGGTLTLDTVQNTYTGTVNAIAGVSATYTISGTNVLVSVTGVVNDNITWNVITKVNTAA